MNEFQLSNGIPPEYFDAPLRLMYRSDLFDELAQIEDAVFAGVPAPKTLPKMDTEDEWDAISHVLQALPDDAFDLPSSGTAWYPPQPLSPDARVFRTRIRLALSAVAEFPRKGEAAYPPGAILPSQLVLLPWRLKDRLLLLLQSQSLPMAWMRANSIPDRRLPARRPDRPE